MDCYRDPRQTNEETDACANVQRDELRALQNRLTSQLVSNCKWLEKCTDTCKSEADMECLNRCGDKYVLNLKQEFDGTLRGYAKQRQIRL